jgi:hypothetical protein
LKIDEFVDQIKNGGNDPKKQILKFLKERPDEVFRRRDIAKGIKANFDTIKTYIPILEKEGKIGRLYLPEKKYYIYGTNEAIEEVSVKLGKKSVPQ